MSTATTITTLSPSSPSVPSPSSLRASLSRDGFVLIPSALPPTLLSNLKTATSHLTTLARSGHWPHVRTVPKQFPPWPQSETLSHGIWGVQHLLHPSLPISPSDKKLLAESYFHPTILSTVCSLLECEEEELVMELYNLLVAPPTPFELRWHRDDVPPSLSPAEEEARLREPVLHAQWNLALYPDTSLVVIPGSHTRARTEIERTADPCAPSLPGQKVVEMQAGDLVFYNNNILHRGVYSSATPRLTLHGSMGMLGTGKGQGEESARSRARNILQHGIGEWAGECDFSGLENERVAKGMQARLIELGRVGGEGVGFSQPD